MKFPKKYRAPKAENLASKADVAWGGCTVGNGFAAGVCDFNGTTASVSCILFGGSIADCTGGASASV